YHTIENKGNIPESIRLDNYIYGCDICLENCIWNKKARIVRTEEFLQRKEITNLLSKAEKDSLEKSDFNRAKKHSALDRIKFDKLKSNIQSCNKNQNLIK
ncbi:MAG TPA: tRNA epoxyqueuosine(34) reductase QueG, partial [Candidatus Onthomorpha intestinigallinarum]|nr:tRNA epoxyqueuosine(34) reductase QueG [Candidatus Onthomorpha intestinigallinarum]